MDLILWRHAEAVEASEGVDDTARPLTSRGEKQAARMATWLDRQLPDRTRIWCSPTRRTEQTVLALGRKYKRADHLAPESAVLDLLEWVQWPQAKGCVLLVGHQPLLGQCIAHIMGLNASECAVKKGAVWWLRYREREANVGGVLVTVQTPELL